MRPFLPGGLNPHLAVHLFFCRYAVSIISVLLFSACSSDDPEKATSVSTFAGNGADGAVDGVGSAASLRNYSKINISPEGGILLCGGLNGVRSVSPDGVVSTYPGFNFTELNIWPDADQITGSFVNALVFDRDQKLIQGVSSLVRVDHLAGLRGVIVKENNGGFDFLFQAGFVFFGGNVQSLAGTSSGALFAGDYSLLYKVENNHLYTFAGGDQGYKDDVGSLARFAFITDIVSDAARNLYITDCWNSCIRKVTPVGVVSTFAGANEEGFRDGPASEARFNRPEGLGIDTDGNLYIADTGNHRIRKVTPDGVVTTLAGDGTAGFRNGDLQTAMFNSPKDVAVNSRGEIYIMDSGNFRVRVIK